MMLALIGFNANAAIYIVGSGPFNNWQPGNGVEMNYENGVYTYTAAINGTVHFVFADGLDSNWNTFNANHRYGPTDGDLAIEPGAWMPAQKAGDHGAYFVTGEGTDFVFTFDEVNQRFKVEGFVPKPEYESFTVVGNNADIFGTIWSPTNADNDMTLDETDGLYKLVRNGIAIPAAYTLEYKVVANHDTTYTYNWGKTPNGQNQDYYFEESGTYNLVFKFDLENQTVSLDATKVEDGPVFDDYYIVAGTENMFGSNWSATDTLNMMTEGEEGMFTWTKTGFEATAGTQVEFKVVANGNWNTCWPIGDENGDNNWWYQFDEDGVYTVVITFNEETKEINLNATRTGDLPEPPQPTVDPVYIMGNVNGYSWDAINGVEMTYDQTNQIYTAEINVDDVNNGLGYFGFTKKLADPESENPWGDIEPFRFGPMGEGEGNWVMTEDLLGADCELDLEGSYYTIEIPAGTWNVAVDLNNGLFTINGTWPTDTVVPEPYTGDVYILGEVNDNGGWFTNVGVKMTRDAENNVYTATITTTGEAFVDPETNIGYSYFSFTKQLADSAADWDAIAPYRFGAANSEGDYRITDETTGIEIGLANGGASFAIPAGEWNLTVSVDNMTLIVEKAENVLIGDANGDGVVNPTDATVLINALLSENFDTIVSANSDMDGNGTVNVTDAILLINYLLTL